jgi:hypothetical protein
MKRREISNKKIAHLRFVNTFAFAFRLGVLIGFGLFRTLLAKLANGVAHSSLLANLFASFSTS